MKAARVLMFVLLVITSSAAAAPARKMAGDDGQQMGEMVTQTEVNVLNGKQSDGYGDHRCSMQKFPACKQGP
ncbi:unnamed protein product [Triticum aestivum]|uniref:Uncharacterized protein n=2 Tax=Triticum aestivum TaxID=4565 RepID=A0A9R1EMP9_WHEAT|nr:hypothetical protein CFC21_027437 [Triticum aestivum]KAF7013353.1 hypothetical protein CFC21_027438 [Triticum aestivum]SPT15804.1 unnamed protein product [Triticum aestivum]